MKTYNNEDQARRMMIIKNKASKKAGKNEIHVLVEGPCDNEFTVMSLDCAVDNGFGYEIVF